MPGDQTHLSTQLPAGPRHVCVDAGPVWMLLVSHPWVLGTDQLWGLHPGFVTRACSLEQVSSPGDAAITVVGP